MPGASARSNPQRPSTRDQPTAFSSALPFEAVDRPRLERLKAERAASQRQLRVGVGRFVDQRRHAQIAARHALQQLGAGLQEYGVRAAELQLPETWLPFVAGRR